MDFKEKMLKHLEKNGIKYTKVEQEGNNASIVVHIPNDENIKIEKIKDEMEKTLDIAVMLSDMGGMNVVIIEDNNL